MRKKGNFQKAKEFAMRMKKVHEETEIALRKSQEDIKKYIDRKKSEVEEYQVGDYMLLSTKYLKYQMQERQLEKLMEIFVEYHMTENNNLIKIISFIFYLLLNFTSELLLFTPIGS